MVKLNSLSSLLYDAHNAQTPEERTENGRQFVRCAVDGGMVAKLIIASTDLDLENAVMEFARDNIVNAAATQAMRTGDNGPLEQVAKNQSLRPVIREEATHVLFQNYMKAENGVDVEGIKTIVWDEDFPHKSREHIGLELVECFFNDENSHGLGQLEKDGKTPKKVSAYAKEKRQMLSRYDGPSLDSRYFRSGGPVTVRRVIQIGDSGPKVQKQSTTARSK